jgi:protein-disulfide isomerase
MTQTLTRRAALAVMAAATGSAVLAQDTTPATDAPVVQEFAMGDPNAPIEIIEYASFTCPHCARFHSDVWPELKANFIDTGKVHFIFRPVYFDGPGLWADMLARCTGDNDKFFGIAGILFERQAEWSRASTQAGVAEGIVSVGRQAGLDEETVLACLQDNDNAQALVAAFQENVARDKIEGTPSFMIDGVLTDNMSYASFAQLLNEKLAE